MRLALLSPVHGTSIEHIARQLDNYRVFLAPFQLRHYLHISLESSSTLKANLLAFAEQEGHDIVITKKSRPTWRPCTANALCELVKTVLADNIEHDKVLIHTDTDLLFTSAAKNLFNAAFHWLREQGISRKKRSVEMGPKSPKGSTN